MCTPTYLKRNLVMHPTLVNAMEPGCEAQQIHSEGFEDQFIPEPPQIERLLIG